MTQERNQSEERLSAALRELAAGSPRGASPEAGVMLKEIFRRHHRRRRRIRSVGIALFALCIALLAGSLLLRESAVQNGSREEAGAVHIIPPQEVSYPPAMSAAKIKRPVLPKNAPASGSTESANTFVALPSLAMVPAGDELRVVRLEMPGEDLRLVGAQVTEEIARRRVTADFVVGHDGTPYAVRLVRSKF